MTTRVYVLRGGLTQFGDGVVTSMGMTLLAQRIRREFPHSHVKTYPWSQFNLAHRDIILEWRLGPAVVIGYSGGGSRATWLAHITPPPQIDLMVLYDPSPSWQMTPIGSNVKAAICYHNKTPMMFGLGGGALHGKQVTTIDIAEQHLAVQFDSRLHDRTIAAIKKL